MGENPDKNPDENSDKNADESATTTTTYAVTGMTCEHCVRAVTDEVGALPGVRSVDVTLVEGGPSAVVVASARPLSEDAVRAAVDEAGYALAGTP